VKETALDGIKDFTFFTYGIHLSYFDSFFKLFPAALASVLPTTVATDRNYLAWGDINHSRVLGGTRAGAEECQ